MVRLKSRYLLVKINFIDKKQYHPINVNEIVDAIHNAVHVVHGENGVSQVLVGLNVKYINVKTKLSIIRVRRKHYQLLATSLPFISSIHCEKSDKKQKMSVSCFFQTLHVAGTIRSLQKFIIKYNNQQLQLLENEISLPAKPLDIVNSYNESFTFLESSSGED